VGKYKLVQQDPIKCKLVQQDPIKCKLVQQDPIKYKLVQQDPIKYKLVQQDPIKYKLVQQDPIRRFFFWLTAENRWQKLRVFDLLLFFAIVVTYRSQTAKYKEQKIQNPQIDRSLILRL
jgi:hypothetical protein